MIKFNYFISSLLTRHKNQQPPCILSTAANLTLYINNSMHCDYVWSTVLQHCTTTDAICTNFNYG